MAATFVSEGRTIDYTPGSDTPAGSIIAIGEAVGIAEVDIPANTLGALRLDGIWDIPKDTPANAVSLGEKVTITAGEADEDAGEGPHLVVKASAANEATVRVKINFMLHPDASP